MTKREMIVQFNVAQLLKEPVGSVRRYELVEDIHGLAAELRVTQPLTGAVQLLHTPDGVLIMGHLSTELDTECSRCLAPVQVPVEMEIEEEFKATVEVVSGTPIAVDPDEDPALLINSQHILDLTEVIRQDLWLAVDLAPVCRPDCKGLCATCGQDLNLGPCACETEDEDPRWAVLRGLLAKEAIEQRKN